MPQPIYKTATGITLPLSGTTQVNFNGTQAAEILQGTAKNDWFYGNGGADKMTGGQGDDVYQVYDKGAQVIEAGNGGIDTIRAGVSYTLPANVENLYFANDQVTGTGNASNNIIIGSDLTQTLIGLGGDDVLVGGGGSDIFVMTKSGGNDIITDFETGADKVRLSGFDISDFSTVRSLMSQRGDDVLLRLTSGDSLVFANHAVGDFSADDFQLSIDTDDFHRTFADEFNALSLRASGGQWNTKYPYEGIAAYTLPTNGEKQIYVDAAFKGTGTTALGVNPFQIKDGVLNITAAKATDAVSAKIWDYDYTSGLLNTKGTFSQLYGYFEISAKMPAGQGLWPAFWLLPENGTWPPEIDIFEQLGRDPNTVYVSNHSKSSGSQTTQTTVVEVATATSEFHEYGVLWDKNFLTYYIDGVEVARRPTPADMHTPMYMLVNLAVGGGWAGNPDPSKPFGGTLQVDYIHAYSLDDAPTHVAGTAGADTLYGSSRVVLAGGKGNDSYIISNIAARIVEGTSEGTDSVASSVSWTLAANLENLTLTGGGNINGYGNDLNNNLIGNSGSNILTGGKGSDFLKGGGGGDLLIGGADNDSYVINDTRDVVTEYANEGTDTISSGFTWTLSSNVENLNLSGTGAINGYGNSLHNTIVGNAAGNRLEGGDGLDILKGAEGNDVLVGGAGRDVLVGGTGADKFVFGAGFGGDTINDFSLAEGDRIELHGLAGVNHSIRTTSTGSIVEFASGDSILFVGLTITEQAFSGFTSGLS